MTQKQVKKTEVKKTEVKKTEVKKAEVKKTEVKKIVPDTLKLDEVFTWKSNEWKVLKNIQTMQVIRAYCHSLEKICLVPYSEL